MINLETAWILIKNNATKAILTNVCWHSIVEKAPYKLIEIKSDRLIIARLNGGNNDELNESDIIKAVKLFNKSNCKIKRRSLISPTVAKETAFVFFHPEIAWDSSGDFIIKNI